VEGALKLVLDKPDAFPNFYRVHDEQSVRGTQEQRDKFISDWQKKRDLLPVNWELSPESSVRLSLETERVPARPGDFQTTSLAGSSSRWPRANKSLLRCWVSGAGSA